MHSYPSIFNLGHKAVREIFLDPVVVQEKIDGSQFSFGRFNGEYKARSRKSNLVEREDKNFAAAVEYTSDPALSLVDGWTYRGEVVARLKHNALTYERVPKNNVILFDISLPSEADFLMGMDLLTESYKIGLESVPMLHHGTIANYMDLKALLDKESTLGGPIEGIVIKNYYRFGLDKHPLFAKWVREEYKEAHKREWTPGPSVVEQIVATLKHERRWEKAIERLRDEGRLQSAPQDIGPLIKEVQADILKEETDWIKEKLFEKEQRGILRGITAGLPEWYKERLVRSQFDEVPT